MSMAEPSLAQLDPSTTSSLNTCQKSGSNHPVHKTLSGAANLANLLPTGTVLVFQALAPSFCNSGTCQLSNQYLTASLITFCATMCFLSSFTDSFTGSDGKLYYGIATFKGLYIFNEDNIEGEEENNINELAKFKIRIVDFVHALLSLTVFLVFALSDPNVQKCFFPKPGANMKALLMNMPLGAGVLSSFLFTIFPTTRRGVGYTDIAPQAK